MIKMLKKLNGHSGCNINLCQKDKLFFVRKDSGSSKYNLRLKKQCKKQNLFHAEQVSSPAILNCGYKDQNIFYFDMEYIEGNTLATELSNIVISDIQSLMNILFNNLYMQNLEKMPKANKIFLNKIQSLYFLQNQYPHLKLALDKLSEFSWDNIEKSPCHGDLTLENILITRDRKLYLIDFLDSFYNSWMIDVAKILQDVDLKWSYRNSETNQNLEIRLLIAKLSLTNEILRLPNGRDKLNTIYHILLLNILRIYPYTKDSKTIKFLDEKVIYLMKILNKDIGETINEYTDYTLCG